MKKYINIKKFMQNHVRNMRLVAMTVAGLGIAISCSTSLAQEGCTPSITVSAGTDPGSCFVAAVTVTCVGDTTSDTVVAQNSLIPGSYYSMSFVTNSGDTCDTTTWSNTIDLVAGVNKITATNSDNGLTSSAVDITQNNGNTWTYTFKDRTSSGGLLGLCGLDMTIKIYCLAASTSTRYKGYETHSYASGEACDGDRGFTDYPGNPEITDGDGTMTIVDTLTAWCPSSSPFSAPCDAVINKTWHIFDLVSNLDATSSADTVTFNRTSAPALTVSDSQISTPETF